MSTITIDVPAWMVGEVRKSLLDEIEHVADTIKYDVTPAALRRHIDVLGQFAGALDSIGWDDGEAAVDAVVNIGEEALTVMTRYAVESDSFGEEFVQCASGRDLEGLRAVVRRVEWWMSVDRSEAVPA